MRDDHGETQDPVEAQDTREDYAVPSLTDLGSFEELTRLSTGPNPDTEGTS
jgi:hypothetical protein